MPVSHLYVFFGKVSVQVLYSFLIKFFVLLTLSCTHSLYISDVNLYVIRNYLLPFSRLPFHHLDGFLRCAKTFSFDVVSFAYFCFCCPCLRRQIQKNISKTNVKEITTYVFLWKIYGFRTYI